MYKWDQNFLFGVEYKIFNKFNNVINIIYNNKIYSILNQHLKPAPYSIILSKNAFESIRKSSENKITFHQKIGTEFSCKIIVNKQNISKINLDLIKKQLDNYPKTDNPFVVYFEEVRSKKDYKKMLGLGIGLTPSGDDYLLGVIATYLSKGLEVPKAIRKTVLNGKDKTNALSLNFLINALEGFFVSEIINLFVNKNATNFENFVEAVLKIGHSSGHDMLLGIYDTLELLEFKRI